MKFGPIAVAAAEGAILAHSTRLKTGTFKKGRVLSADDVLALTESGVTRVVAAVLEVGDVHEDPAAEALARACGGPGVRVGAPFTGRSNLHAADAGLLVVERHRVDDINGIDEGITVATLPSGKLVSARQMLATIKIIPFSVATAKLDAALAMLNGTGPLLRVHALAGFTAALVQSQLPSTKSSVLDKTVRVMGSRMSRLNGTLVYDSRCEHEPEAVATEVRAALDLDVDVVMVAGASAIVDRRDVIPAGIGLAGGSVDHFGMPVDPGNLILLAHRGATPILGLPGCARSPAYNGVDLVLERVAAGLSVTPADITAMGVGGLLKETGERAQPRAGGAEAADTVRAPRIAAVVMAAGQSRRMGATNKLLAVVDGTPMVRRAVEAALASNADGVYVVLGHEADAVAAALDGLKVEYVKNPSFGEGMSTSVAAGIAALPPDIDGALICLGDMPRISAGHLNRLIAAFDVVEGRLICVPTHRGKRGNPVLWSARYFAEICAVRGDVGARHLIGEHQDDVCEVAMPDSGVLLDVDSPAALSELLSEATS